MSATITDQITPSFTTHIIASVYTAQLKQEIQLLQGKTIENHNKQLKQSEASAKIIGHSHNMKVVTKEWLEDCLTSGAIVSEERYLPELVQQGQSNQLEGRKKGYIVKRGLFQNMTFAIRDEFYTQEAPD